MWSSAHDAYLEDRVLSASPIELIRMLYQSGVAAIRDARERLAAGDIVARARAITKARDIVAELENTLDRERGGDLAVRLAALYRYIRQLLLKANFEQQDGPLAEALSLMATLAEGWNGISSQAPVWQRPEPRPEYTSQAWSF